MFILLVILQVLVLYKISFLGFAVPHFYILFILKLAIGTDRKLTTFLGFLLGFTIDIFCNTPGINAAATTLIAFFNQPIQGLFFLRDDYTDQTPGISLLGSAYIKYAVLITCIHHLALILLESFSYFNIKLMGIRLLSSILLTLILIFIFEGFSIKKKKKAW